MPENLKIVIVNTTPIISLSILGLLELLKNMYGEVIVPSAVHKEVLAGGKYGIGVREYIDASWIQKKEIKNRALRKHYFDLDDGEAEVLVLAEELEADLVIIDEYLGRKYAEILGFKLTGTLGILLKAKEQGKIKAVKSLIEKLQQAGVWFSKSLIDLVLMKASEY